MTPEPRDLMRGLNARERAVLLAIHEHKVLLTKTPGGYVLRVGSARPGSSAPSRTTRAD